MNYTLLDNDTETIKYKTGFFKKKYKILYKKNNITNNYYIEIYTKNEKIFEGYCKYKILQKKNNLKNKDNILFIKKSNNNFFYNLINLLNINEGIFYKNFYIINDSKEKIYIFKKISENKYGFNGKIITHNNNKYEGYFKYIKNENCINIFSIYLKKGEIIYNEGQIKKGNFNRLYQLNGNQCLYNNNNNIKIGKFINNKLYEGMKIYNNKKIIGEWNKNYFLGKYIYPYGMYEGIIYKKKLINGFFIIYDTYIYSIPIFCNNYELYYNPNLKIFKGIPTAKKVNNYVTRIYLNKDIYVNCFLDKNYFINLKLYNIKNNLNIFDYILNIYKENLSI